MSPLIHVGTSGFSYPQWKGAFYPENLPAAGMLRYYASQFRTVEINNTFYRMPSAAMLEGWASQVPDRFSFVLKASRRITHQGRINADTVADSVAYLFDRATALGDKLGPVLFQLPPFLKLDLERLQRFLALLPAGRRAALEFRHASWFEPQVFDALRGRNVALCCADGELKEELPFVATADWGYLRLRDENYDDAALGDWGRRIREQPWSEAFVFFKHEETAAGALLARRMVELLQ